MENTEKSMKLETKQMQNLIWNCEREVHKHIHTFLYEPSIKKIFPVSIIAKALEVSNSIALP